MHYHLFVIVDVPLGEVVPLAVQGLQVAGRLEGVPEPLHVDHRGLDLLLRDCGLHLRVRGTESRIFKEAVQEKQKSGVYTLCPPKGSNQCQIALQSILWFIKLSFAVRDIFSKLLSRL